jgi:Zn-finger nucleic acid-binding protein
MRIVLCCRRIVNREIAIMKCPKCRLEDMRAESYEDMQVERCPVCRGLYLDRGELASIQRVSEGMK